MQLHIASEYNKLEAVLVHRPGAEIDRLTHEIIEAYLFEDIPYLRRMQEEHDAFVECMRQRNINVVYLEDLLGDLLDRDDARRDIVQEVCAAEQVPGIAADLLDESKVDRKRLLEVLFGGMTRQEYADLNRLDLRDGDNPLEFILPPIPNAYFSRDPAVVVGSSAISCKMHYVQRLRETVLTRAVLEKHPEFAGNRLTYGGSSFPTEDRPFTIEGGDVAVINAEAILVGASERTRSETIQVLAQKAFDMGEIKRVYEVPIPTERLFMHLDTVFTIIDHATVVWFPGVMSNIDRIVHHQQGPAGGVVQKADDRNLKQILNDEFGKEISVIETAGGDEHYAAREQRTDGTNLFAIAPRTAISYDRNERTTAALRKADIECITIPGSELVRGLGGPRCMTMPLRRTSG